MRRFVRHVVAGVAMLAALPTLSWAQAGGGGGGGAPTKIPAGVYTMVPDSTYNVDFDAASVSIEFSDSLLTATQAGTLLAKSRLDYKGNEVTLTDLDGQVMCPTPARYRVEIKGNEVRLRPIEDACDQRSVVLAQVRMVRKV